ncbi:MAG: imidazoleglycerol-phosphate dehydratase, partial [Cyanobium sp. MAG_185]|nr:imidazoleglycerol-phosphate dehydratase [Cyanobium sp. MAG_185]
MRTGSIHRVTGETDVRVSLGLDGSGRCEVNTGV